MLLQKEYSILKMFLHEIHLNLFLMERIPQKKSQCKIGNEKSGSAKKSL